jgi:hypothetical protein
MAGKYRPGRHPASHRPVDRPAGGRSGSRRGPWQLDPAREALPGRWWAPPAWQAPAADGRIGCSESTGCSPQHRRSPALVKGRRGGTETRPGRAARPSEREAGRRMRRRLRAGRRGGQCEWTVRQGGDGRQAMWAGLRWAEVGWAGAGAGAGAGLGWGWAGLGWAGLGWAGLGWAGLGWAGLGRGVWVGCGCGCGWGGGGGALWPRTGTGAPAAGASSRLTAGGSRLPHVHQRVGTLPDSLVPLHRVPGHRPLDHGVVGEVPRVAAAHVADVVPRVERLTNVHDHGAEVVGVAGELQVAAAACRGGGG